eukprot:260447-Pyramimonas_sp.AAC.1
MSGREGRATRPSTRVRSHSNCARSLPFPDRFDDCSLSCLGRSYDYSYDFLGWLDFWGVP